jgi:hypothetical protein
MVRLPCLAIGLLLFLGFGILEVDLQAEMVDGPINVAPLPAETQKRVNEAIDGGVAYLRRHQLENGYFHERQTRPQHPVGYAALPALALLESGVAPADPAIQNAVRYVRDKVPTMTQTYEISLAILFLNRMGEGKDRPLIRTLILRLLAGQTGWGGWGYSCPLLHEDQEEKLLKILREKKPPKKWKEPAVTPVPKMGTKLVTRDRADNSNTQFAILAIGVARKYDLPLDYTIAWIENRFRTSQLPSGGWGYNRHNYVIDPYGSMTCVGLLGLAIGYGSSAEPLDKAPKAEDKGIDKGLRALDLFLEDPSDTHGAAAWPGLGPKGAVNVYFLWSVERVGVLLGLETIGGKDWYRWGVKHLLPAQKADGSWLGRGNSGRPVIDTSMALLFLKRSTSCPIFAKRCKNA